MRKHGVHSPMFSIKRMFTLQLCLFIYFSGICFLYPSDSKIRKNTKFIFILFSSIFVIYATTKIGFTKRFYHPVKISYNNPQFAEKVLLLPSLNNEKYVIPMKLRTGIQHTIASYKHMAPEIKYIRENIQSNRFNVPNDTFALDWAKLPDIPETSTPIGISKLLKEQTQVNASLDSIKSTDSLSTLSTVSSYNSTAFLDKDEFNKYNLPASSPIVIILHSLGGGSRERCVRRYCKILLENGYRPVVIIARGFSGTQYDKKIIDQYNLYHLKTALDKDQYIINLRNSNNESFNEVTTISDNKKDKLPEKEISKLGAIYVSNYMDLDEWPEYIKEGYPRGHFHTLGMDFRDALTAIQYITRKYPEVDNIFFTGFSIGAIQCTHLANFISKAILTNNGKIEYEKAKMNLEKYFGKPYTNIDFEEIINDFNYAIFTHFEKEEETSIENTNNILETSTSDASIKSISEISLSENINAQSKLFKHIDFSAGYFTREKLAWYNDYLFVTLYNSCKKIKGIITLFENWNRETANSFDRDHSSLATSVLKWLDKNIEYVKATGNITDKEIEDLKNAHSLSAFESMILTRNSHYENRKQYNDDLFASRMLNSIKNIPFLSLNSRDDPIGKDYIPSNFAIYNAMNSVRKISNSRIDNEESTTKEQEKNSVVLIQINEGGHLGGIIADYIPHEKNEKQWFSHLWGGDYYSVVSLEFMNMILDSISPTKTLPFKRLMIDS